MPTKVWCICPFSRPQQLAHVLEGFARQTYEHKHLVLVCNGRARALAVQIRESLHDPQLTVLDSDHNVSIALNVGLAFVRAYADPNDLMAKTDDDDYQGPRYLAQIAHKAQTSTARAFGRMHVWVRSQGDRLWSIDYGSPQENAPHGPTLAARVDTCLDFPSTGNVPWGEDFLWWEAMRRRVEVASLPREGFCWNRYKDPHHEHTYPLCDEDLQSMAILGAYDHGPFTPASLDVVNGLAPAPDGRLLPDDVLDFDRMDNALNLAVSKMG